jgi:hypothetical protein
MGWERPRRKMGHGALGPGMNRFDKESVLYFNKDLEGPQISENGPDSLEPKDEQIPHI